MASSRAALALFHLGEQSRYRAGEFCPRGAVAEVDEFLRPPAGHAYLENIYQACGGG
jgi:hypothetical protein